MSEQKSENLGNPPKKAAKDRMLIEEHVAGFFLGVMLILAFINIISRVVSGFSFAFTEEIVVYLFVCSTFLGISSGVYRELHLSVTILPDFLESKGIWPAKLVFEIIHIIAVLLLFGVLGYYSFELCLKQIRYAYGTPILQIPTWIFTSSMVIGSAAFIVRSLIKFVQNMRDTIKRASGEPTHEAKEET